MKQCCGRKRAAVAGQAGAEGSAQLPYRYQGLRPLIVRGGSGRLYRFTPGAIQMVNAADAGTLEGIPGLAAAPA